MKKEKRVRANRSAKSTVNQTQTSPAQDANRRRLIYFQLPKSWLPVMDEAAEELGISRSEFINEALRERVNRMARPPAATEQPAKPSASAPAAVRGNNKMGWTNEELAIYRGDLERGVVVYELMAAVLHRASLAKSGVKRRGAIFSAAKMEREVALKRKTLAAEDFGAAVYEYRRHFDNERRLSELRRDYECLEESRLDGLSPTLAEMWYLHRDDCLRQFVKSVKRKPSASRKGGAK